MPEKKRILFVCVENACRSQMAEAFASKLAGSGMEVYSAGSKPSGSVNTRAAQVMQELGYDLSAHRPKGIDTIPTAHYDYLITMGCGDACPHISAENRIDWDIPDPKSLPLEQFRQVRDQLQHKVMALINLLRKEKSAL